MSMIFGRFLIKSEGRREEGRGEEGRGDTGTRGKRYPVRKHCEGSDAGGKGTPKIDNTFPASPRLAVPASSSSYGGTRDPLPELLFELWLETTISRMPE